MNVHRKILVRSFQPLAQIQNFNFLSVMIHLQPNFGNCVRAVRDVDPKAKISTNVTSCRAFATVVNASTRTDPSAASVLWDSSSTNPVINVSVCFVQLHISWLHIFIDNSSWHWLDDNECAVDNICRNGTCTNVEGGFECECTDGFAPGPMQVCEDVDECQEMGHQCAFRCHNVPGSFRCICPYGYALAADGRHCQGSTRPPQIISNSPLNFTSYV